MFKAYKHTDRYMLQKVVPTIAFSTISILFLIYFIFACDYSTFKYIIQYQLTDISNLNTFFKKFPTAACCLNNQLIKYSEGQYQITDVDCVCFHVM